MSITGKSLIAGVLGWPVAHSRSPQLHGFWLDAYGIDGAYIPLPVEPENLEMVLRTLPAMGFRGANLTVPHKRRALDFLDEIDDPAARIGAVNTVVVGEGGRLMGTNTDGYGFFENIRQGAPNWKLENGPMVVLGAGGAARAICVALLDGGANHIILCNRSRGRAEDLAGHLQNPNAKIEILDWSARADCLDGATMLINTTSLGMTGQPALEIDLAALPNDAIVNDIVYSPLETDLLADAKLKGCIFIDGLGMLLHQARPAFSAWFGVDPEVTTALRKHVLNDRPDAVD